VIAIGELLPRDCDTESACTASPAPTGPAMWQAGGSCGGGRRGVSHGPSAVVGLTLHSGGREGIVGATGDDGAENASATGPADTWLLVQTCLA
jgi:hypothetical protein